LKDLPPIIKKNLTIIPVEHMDEVLRLALRAEGPGQFLDEDDGIHEIEEIYLASGGLKQATTELPHPAGVN
jgi:predicted ATP-dependent protease